MKFVLAEPEHEPALRSLIRADSMPGPIRLAFSREPDFFQGLATQGAFNQVVAAIENDAVVGMGCRSIRPMWVNGSSANFGYLSGLRSLMRARRATGLARGYKFFHGLHQDGRAVAYLTTIMEDHRDAIQILTSGRAGLPHYLDQGRYNTYAISLPIRCESPVPSGLTVRSGSDISLESIVDFWNSEGKRHPFFPIIGKNDFGSPLLRDLRPENIRVAMEGDRIVGAMAGWDQRAYKQIIVDGYSGLLGTLRPLINGWFHATRGFPLPAVGCPVDLFYAAFALARNDDPAIFEFLLNAVCNDAKGFRYCVLGFHERDPLRSVMQKYRTIKCRSRIFLVCWDEGLEWCRSLAREMPLHLEVALL